MKEDENTAPYFDDFALPESIKEVDLDTFNLNRGENMTSIDIFDWSKALDYDQILEVRNEKQVVIYKVTQKKGLEIADWREIARLKDKHLTSNNPHSMLGAICTALWYARNT